MTTSPSASALVTLLLCWTALGTPVRVIDGDTVVIDVGIWVGLTSRESVRVLEVDTPERGTPGYLAAKDFTTMWLSGAQVQVNVCRRDSFGRALASVVRTSDGANLAVDLIQAGHAEPYRK